MSAGVISNRIPLYELAILVVPILMANEASIGFEGDHMVPKRESVCNGSVENDTLCGLVRYRTNPADKRTQLELSQQALHYLVGWSGLAIVRIFHGLCRH